jgi:hypothetical protein
MAQNQLSIIAPRSAPQEQKKQKPDDWERVLQGLQIANGVLGIGVNFTTIQNHMAQKQQIDDERNGIITQKQLLDAQKSGLVETAPGTAGATAYKVSRGDEPPAETALMTPAKPAATAAAPKSREFDGKLEEWDPATKSWKTVGIAKPKPKDTTARDIARDDRKTKSINDGFDDLTKQLTGIRSTIGQEKTKLRTATHALNIIEGADLNNLTPIQIKEISGALAAQVTQGSPAQRTLEEMTPQTAAGDLAKVVQYITGGPEPANQGEFASQFRAMIERQMETSRDIIQGEVGPIIANSSWLSEHDPKRWNKILKAAGITADQDGVVTAYEPGYAKQKPHADVPGGSGTAIAAPGGGKKAAPAANLDPQAGTAEKWARANENSPDPAIRADAQALLKQLGLPPRVETAPGTPNRLGNKFRGSRG